MDRHVPFLLFCREILLIGNDDSGEVILDITNFLNNVVESRTVRIQFHLRISTEFEP